MRFARPAAATLLITTATLALWPKARTFEDYTSPPFVMNGGQVVLRGKVPAGWVALEFVRSSPKGAQSIAEFDLAPPRRTSWLDRLRQTFGMKAEYDPRLTIQVFPGSHPSGRSKLLTSKMGDGRMAAHHDLDGQDCVCIMYFRENHAEFDVTYRQICQSFRATPP